MTGAIADFELSFNEEELALVHGWQRKPGSVRLLAPKEALRQLQSLMPKPSELGPQDEDDDALLSAQQYALDKYGAGKRLPPDPLGDAGAAALIALAQQDYGRDPTQRSAWPLVDYWVKESGASYALDVLLLETTLETFRNSQPSVRRVEHGSLLGQGYVGKWQRLREILNGLSDSDYRTVEAHAARLRESKPNQRPEIAYLFPGRPDWAAADAQQTNARYKRAKDHDALDVDFNLLALSLDSCELVCAHFSLWDAVYTDGRAHTLLLRFGQPFAEHLAEQACSNAYVNHRAIELLGAVGSTAIARRLIPLLNEPRVFASLTTALDRQARHALPALEEEIKKMSRPKPALKGLLRDWREAYPELAANVPKPQAKPAKVAQKVTKSALAKRPRGVARVLAQPIADLSPAGQQALRDIEACLLESRKPEAALRALAGSASPGAARRVRALTVSWAAADEPELAQQGLRALAAAGDDFSIGQLATIRDGASNRKLSEAAQRALLPHLKRTGLSEADLEDRKLDDFGLGAPLTLTLGKRQLAVELGASMNFVLRGDDGKAKASFPTQRKDDEAEAYKLAKETWENLRTVAAPELRQQARRLESGMVEERGWSSAAFLGVVLRQPLLAYLARQLIWRATTGKTTQSFRVAEDGTLADRDDAAFGLTATARVTLPHPIAIAGELSRWGELLADYEITQPFDQLGREFVPAGESAQTFEQRLAGTSLGPKARFVLEGLGWEGEENYGFGWSGSKRLRGEALSLSLYRADDGFTYGLDFEPAKLDAIARSEVYRDLAKCGLRREK